MNRHATALGRIAGVVSAVPSNVITNADCPDPAAADEAAKLTGVRERRWVRNGQTARTLCTAAAHQLLLRLGWHADELDLIVYVTQTPEAAVPADVYRIAADLGAPGAVCIQANWSCSGYVYGLWTAMRLLQHRQRALLLVGDATSTIADPGDRATAPLFGDAGSATAVVGDVYLPQDFVLGSDGTGASKLCQQGPGLWLQMDGGAVFNFTLKHVPPLVADVLAFGRPDLLLFHQANAYMLGHLVRKSKLVERFEQRQIPVNIERFGNCSCASIPLLMSTDCPDRLQNKPTRLAMFGFGAGWAWAGASIRCAERLEACELIEV